MYFSKEATAMNAVAPESYIGDPTEAGDSTADKFKWKDTEYDNYVYIIRQQGWIEEFFDGEEGDYCQSGLVLIPGTTLLPKGLLAIMYALFLGWLFLGISIVADIFMEAIEVITSQVRIIQIEDPQTGKIIEIEDTVWNATIANLTLMALGSSAPEILLAVIEAL
jgi:solute carrier family 8 (sodium/calcium exchanger)